MFVRFYPPSDTFLLYYWYTRDGLGWDYHFKLPAQGTTLMQRLQMGQTGDDWDGGALAALTQMLYADNDETPCFDFLVNTT